MLDYKYTCDRCGDITLEKNLKSSPTGWSKLKYSDRDRHLCLRCLKILQEEETINKNPKKD